MAVVIAGKRKLLPVKLRVMYGGRVDGMRVAMISMHTSPLMQPGTGDAGGMNVYVAHTAKELGALGVEVDIYTRATGHSQKRVENPWPGVRVINVVAGPFEGLAKEALPTQLAAFAGGVILYARCHGITYDIVHSHYWLSGQVGWLLRDLWEVPLVHTAHTLAAVKNLRRSADDSPESEARRICEQQIVDNADLLVVNTDEEKESLIRHYDASAQAIAAIAPGADTDLFCPGNDRATERARRELGIPLHAKVVAFVGRLQKFKGPQVLIQALAAMQSSGWADDVRLVICGGVSGPDATPGDYTKLAKDLGVDGKIRFLDPRPPEELVAVYRAADVQAVPSYNESFGLVAIEAQAAGTPVVAAKRGGLPTAVIDGETGLLVDGHEATQWAGVLHGIFTDDETRIAMGQRAVTHAATFSWAIAAGKLLDCYESVAAANPDWCHGRDAAGATTTPHNEPKQSGDKTVKHGGRKRKKKKK